MHLKQTGFAFDRTSATLPSRLLALSAEFDLGTSSWKYLASCPPRGTPPPNLCKAPDIGDGLCHHPWSKREAPKGRAVLREGGCPFFIEVHCEAHTTPGISPGPVGSCVSVFSLQALDQRPWVHPWELASASAEAGAPGAPPRGASQRRGCSPRAPPAPACLTAGPALLL